MPVALSPRPLQFFFAPNTTVGGWYLEYGTDEIALDAVAAGAAEAVVGTMDLTAATAGQRNPAAMES